MDWPDGLTAPRAPRKEGKKSGDLARKRPDLPAAAMGNQSRKKADCAVLRNAEMQCKQLFP